MAEDVRTRYVSPFDGGQIGTHTPIVRRLKATTSFIADWEWADVWMEAPGGGGANSASATRGAAGASSGQVCIGRFRFQRGARYTYTQGAQGTGATVTGGVSTPGNSAGVSTLTGPGISIRLQGGFGGRTTGDGGGVGLSDVGTSGVSPLGYTTYPIALGGSSVENGLGITGADASAPVMAGGRPGATGYSGGGGGSTPSGQGGNGGSAASAGGSAPVDSGAGGGGAGASADGYTTYAGGSGGRGFCQISEVLL